ncbi:MAG: aspartate aminotransferase family protein [Acidobacteria bacterium]|nr:aspartate aminotransferase family protein [Acidobacteriota bacterium]
MSIEDGRSIDTATDAGRIVADAIQDAATRAARYAREVAERRVFPTPDVVAALDQLDGPMPAHGSAASDVLRRLDEVASPATVACTAGRYFGFVIGGAVPAAAAASVLNAAWDQNAAMRATSPAAVRLEEIALGWARDLLGLPHEARGALVTCTTVANVAALAAARHALLARHGWDVEARGLFGAPDIPVIVGDEVHVSVRKALAVIGFGRDRMITVPTDAQGRMRVDALPRLTGPAIVCIQAGNVNTGSFDPADAICRVVHDAGGWVHVDGAFGLWAASAPQRAHLTQGIALADSWATDGHKWLNVPYDCGFVFVREPEPLFRAMRMHAEYLQTDQAWEPLHWTPDSSRRARGVEVWAALKSLGRGGVADLIERTCRHATRFAQRLREAGYEILNEVVLNQVLVSFGSDARTKAVIAAVQEDGTCWCGGTVWHGRQAMRISVSSWATTARDVEISADAIIRLASQAPA